MTVASQDVAKELRELEKKLSSARERVEEEQSTFSTLEEELRELRGRLTLTRRDVTDFEALVVQKQAELAESQRAEALNVYQEAVETRDQAATRLAEAATQVLTELEAYDSAREAVEAAQELAGAPDGQEPEVLAESWDRLVDAVRQRINEQFEDELVEAASRSLKPGAIEALPEHLREAARERARARLQQPRRSGT
jgi:hypothetical protein